MPSPKMIELNMKRQLLRKDSIKVLTQESGLNREGRRKMDKIIRAMPKKQVEALLMVAKERGIIKDEDLQKP